MAAREVLGHRRCAGWLGGDGGCGTSVGEGTARGGRLLVVTRCAPYSTAAPVCCHSSQLASLKQALGGSSYPHLADGGSANVTTSSLHPLA